MSNDRILGYLLTSLGVGIGTLSTSLMYEVAPALMEFKDGVNSTLQGAAVGLAIGMLMATVVVFIEGINLTEEA